MVAALRRLRSLPPICLAALAVACAASRGASPDTMAARMRFAAAVANGFSGVVLIASSTHDDAWAAGTADRGAGTEMRADTLFRFASITKQMTAVLVMQAVERGRFALDDSAARIWPTCAVPAADRITVRQLLTHMSGLPNPEQQGAFTDAALVGRTHRELLATLPSTAAAAPGERFDYNNADYWLLGALLEHVHGCDYATLLERDLFRPCGMRTAGVYRGPAPADHARGYLGPQLGAEPNHALAVYGAAGAAFGTVDDLLQFDRALLAGRLLSADSWRTLTTPNEQGAALGVWSYELARGDQRVRVIERQGWIGGVKVLNLISPSHDRITVVLSNDDRPALDSTWSGKGLGAELLLATLPAAH